MALALSKSLSDALNGAVGAPVVVKLQPGALSVPASRARERVLANLGLPNGFRVRVAPRLSFASFFLPSDLADKVAGMPNVQAVLLDRQVGVPEVIANGGLAEALTQSALEDGAALLNGGLRSFLKGQGVHVERKGLGVLTPQALDWLGVPAARAAGYRGEGVRVGIVDSDASHRLLEHPQVRGKGVERYLVRPEAQTDSLGHGSHVTSISTGNPWTTQDGLRFEGVAPKAKVLLAKALYTPLGTGSESDIIHALDQALTWADGAPLVVNMSLGVSRVGPNAPTPGDSALVHAVERIKPGDAVVCCAAGNDGGPVNLPAAAPSAVAVSAVSLPDGKVAPFSSRGPEVVTGMPGVNITSGIEEGTLLDILGKAGVRLATLSGTSMATPFTTGMVALFMQASLAQLQRRVTGADVKAALAAYGKPHDDALGNGPLTWDVVRQYLAAPQAQVQAPLVA